MECINPKSLFGSTIRCGNCDGCRGVLQTPEDMQADAEAKAIRRSLPPAQPPTPISAPILPDKPKIDYIEIFNHQGAILHADGFTLDKATDDDTTMTMVDALQKRIDTLEHALEELRIRKQKTISLRDEFADKLTEGRRRKLSERDMEDRQKKQEQKINRDVAIKKQQAAKYRQEWKLACFDDAEIDALLKKRGLL